MVRPSEGSSSVSLALQNVKVRYLLQCITMVPHNLKDLHDLGRNLPLWQPLPVYKWRSG